MSVAKSVLEVEPTRLDWFNVGDMDGIVYRYARRGNSASSVVHVKGEYSGGPIRVVLYWFSLKWKLPV